MHEFQLLPGSAFLRPSEEFTVRLCYVDFDGAKAVEIYRKQSTNGHPGGTGSAFPNDNDNDLVEAMAPRVVEGIKRLKAFAKKYQ